MPNNTNNIKSIACLSKLDSGSSNQGDGSYKKGLIYGKTYTFQAKVDKSSPIDWNKLHWKLASTSDDGSMSSYSLDERGETIKLTIKDKNLLGKNLILYAYIPDSERQTEIKLFCHYRFRYFDRKTIEKEIEVRTNRPYRIQQNSTSLCGMACIVHTLIKRNPEHYKNLALTLHQKGEASINGYKIKPEDHFFEISKRDRDYPKIRKRSMPGIDWVLMASLRNTENRAYNGKKGEDWDAINWPWLMKKLSKELLGAEEIIDNLKVLDDYFKDKTYNIEKMDVFYRSGYQIIMMVDYDILYEKKSTVGVPNHWISFLGNYSYNIKKKKFSFYVFSWGRRIKLNLSTKTFSSNSFGFLAIK